jgi:phosphatidylserine decarboxylase
LRGRRNPWVAREGIPFLLLAALACWLTYRQGGLAWLPVPGSFFVAFYLVFRDPHRAVPAAPLGVVSPVDGEVTRVERVEGGVLQGRAHRIVIRIDSLGTYTARSPVEGKITDFSTASKERVRDYRTNALWLKTDEGDDVVLQFTGFRFGIPPRSFARYGERLGQGSRCAYLRLTRYAEVHLPVASKVLVEPGQTLRAGTDLIGRLPHP